MASRARKTAAQSSYQQGERKNFFYNGNMEICQRATSVADLGNGDSGYHVQDRYKFAEAGAPNAVVTMSQSTTAPDGFFHSMKYDCTTASGTVAAGDLIYFSQIFEGLDLLRIKKGTAQARALTVSFWVNTTKTGTYIVSMYDNDNARSCSQAYTVSSSDTWEYKTVTFPPDTTGAYDNDNAASLYVHWGLVAGTDWTSGTLATAWQSNVSADQFTGQVDAFDSTSNNFHITGIQMELGNTATDFQYESYAENLSRCHRYYYNAAGTKYAGRYSGAYSFTDFDFSPEMRAAPSILSYTGVRTTTGLSYYSNKKWFQVYQGATDGYITNPLLSAEL